MNSFSLLGILVAASALTIVSCSPLESNAVQHSGGSPVYGPPGTWGSGGHYTGFSASRPSAHGYESGSSGAPC